MSNIPTGKTSSSYYMFYDRNTLHTLQCITILPIILQESKGILDFSSLNQEQILGAIITPSLNHLVHLSFPSVYISLILHFLRFIRLLSPSHSWKSIKKSSITVNKENPSPITHHPSQRIIHLLPWLGTETSRTASSL